MPEFVAAQLEFAAHIRNPDVNPMPAGIEARRMKIYNDLFYNNIESFLAGGFPVCKKILTSDEWSGVPWRDLVRSFVHRHGSSSPYFLEISQEFLEFVSGGAHAELPDWFLELAHYEWVEMALAVADEEFPQASDDESGDVCVSPLVWPLTYRYPVHQIGPGHLPSEAPEQPTHLIVYRRRDDSVRFLASNVVTHLLVTWLGEGLTVEEVVIKMSEQLQIERDVVDPQTRAALARLRECDIVFTAAK